MNIWSRPTLLTWLLMGWIITHIVIGIAIVGYEKQIIEPKNRADFLTSGLHATAAIVGIVFAISILVIEHSANNYSPTVLEHFRKDWFVWFTLGYGLFTMAFMGLTIMYGWEVLLLCSILFLWNLVLLGIYLRYIL